MVFGCHACALASSHRLTNTGIGSLHGPVNIIIKARKIILDGKYQRHYLVRFKNQTADMDKWLKEDAIPDGNLYISRLRASRRTEQSHQ
ncbi:hypothetical protein O181_005169 [Austropuccinia psidii MF-1]|uniref:Uncharacterized protein n=1 Tax=Austropuccinia psidii MF-1 TaxID=1389203 RepID=A0A9Q3BHL3_9BASI|nr:hypothetical protein [Austropuccinia psidii MF-1]